MEMLEGEELSLIGDLMSRGLINRIPEQPSSDDSIYSGAVFRPVQLPDFTSSAKKTVSQYWKFYSSFRKRGLGKKQAHKAAKKEYSRGVY